MRAAKSVGSALAASSRESPRLFPVRVTATVVRAREPAGLDARDGVVDDQDVRHREHIESLGGVEVHPGRRPAPKNVVGTDDHLRVESSGSRQGDDDVHQGARVACGRADLDAAASAFRDDFGHALDDLATSRQNLALQGKEIGVDQVDVGVGRRPVVPRPPGLGDPWQG